MTSRTDKNSRLTNFTYDNLGRRTAEDWMSGGSSIYTATYAYDASGHLTSASDGNSAYAMTYNSNGRVTQIDNNGTATGPRVVLNLTYDNLSRLTSQAATVSSTNDFLNTYTYNAASQLTKITQEGQSGGNSVAAKRVDFTYTATGQLSTADRFANLTGTQLVATSTWGYDNKGQATSLTDIQGSTTFASRTWTYDRIGRLTAEAESVLSVSDSYTYDATGQVTAATHSGGGNESYSYDANGNRTNTGYTTTTNNQLTSDGTYNYLYDNEGNVTKKTTISSGDYVTYTWDYHNRLTDVKKYNSSNALQSHFKYTYDVFNRLIEKQVDPTGGGTFTTKQDYLYDSASNIVLVYNSSGTLTDRMLNGFALNQHLADENGSGTVSWYLTDRAGTVNDVIRYNSGTGVTSVVNHLTYGAFGNITAQTNSANQPLFAYTGQMWDADAGLYYYHARWYDARVGRFLSQDPKSFAAGDTDLYRYVGNSPTNFSDPSGMNAVNVCPQLIDYAPPGVDLATWITTAAGQAALAKYQLDYNAWLVATTVHVQLTPSTPPVGSDTVVITDVTSNLDPNLGTVLEALQAQQTATQAQLNDDVFGPLAVITKPTTPITVTIAFIGGDQTNWIPVTTIAYCYNYWISDLTIPISIDAPNDVNLQLVVAAAIINSLPQGTTIGHVNVCGHGGPASLGLGAISGGNINYVVAAQGPISLLSALGSHMTPYHPTMDLKLCEVTAKPRNQGDPSGQLFILDIAAITGAEVHATNDVYAVVPHGEELIAHPDGTLDSGALYNSYSNNYFWWVEDIYYGVGNLVFDIVTYMSGQ